MTYNTDLQSNNVELQEILNTINSLPEAGSGGGTAVETCTVYNEQIFDIVYVTAYVDGSFTTVQINGGESNEQVVKNSLATLVTSEAIEEFSWDNYTCLDMSLTDIYPISIDGDCTIEVTGIGGDDLGDGDDDYPF